MRNVVEFVSGFLIPSVWLGFLFWLLVNGLDTELDEGGAQEVFPLVVTAGLTMLTILISYIVLLVFSLIIIARTEHRSVGLGSCTALLLPFLIPPFLTPFTFHILNLI